MKRLIFILIFLPLFSVGQGFRSYYQVPTDSTAFGQTISKGTAIFQSDLGKWYKADTILSSVQTIKTSSVTLAGGSSDSSWQSITVDTIKSSAHTVFPDGINIPGLANSISKVLTLDTSGNVDTTQTSTLSDYFANNTIVKIKVDSLSGVKTINNITGDKVIYVDGATGYVAGKSQTNIETYVFDSVNVGSLTTGRARVVMDTIGGVRLYNSATAWDDLFFPFTTGQHGVAGYPPFIADSNYYEFTTDTTGVSQCVIYFIVQMPHRWKEGSNLYPHVHYKHTTSAGTPTFRLRYKWYEGMGSTSNQAVKYYTMNQTTGTTNNTLQMAYGTGSISGAGKTISSILICQVYLVSTTGAAPVLTYQMDIHIEIDSFGSRTETTK